MVAKLLFSAILVCCATISLAQTHTEIQAQLDVSGPDVLPWTMDLQAATAQLVANVTNSSEVMVVGSRIQSVNTLRRLLQASTLGVRVTMRISTTTDEAMGVMVHLTALYPGQASGTGSLQDLGYNAVVRLYSMATTQTPLVSTPAWRARFIVATVVLGTAVLLLLAAVAGLALVSRRLPKPAHDSCKPSKVKDGGAASALTDSHLGSPGNAPRGPLTGTEEEELVQRAAGHANNLQGVDLKHSGQMARQALEEDSLFGTRAGAGHSSADSTLVTCDKPDGEARPAASSEQALTGQRSTSLGASPGVGDIARAMRESLTIASAPAAVCLAPLIQSSIPAGLPEDVHKYYADFLSLWKMEQEGCSSPWLQPASVDGRSAVLEQQCSRSVSGKQTSSESELCLNSSHSLSTLLARHPDWELPQSELLLSLDADGQPVKLWSSSSYSTYSGTLGGEPVLVQAPHLLTDGFAPEVLAEVSVQLKELNSCPYLPHFYGTVLADRPLLVIEDVRGNVRTLITEAEQPFWYTHGKQLALDIAQGLDYLHSRDVVLGHLTSSCVALDARGTPKFMAAGIHGLLLRSGKLRRKHLCPLDWAPPEVLLGQRRGVAADIFQFALLVWELITRDVPIRGALRSVAVPDECPAAIASMLVCCMARNPSARPTSAQIIASIQEVWEQAPPPAAAVSPAHSLSQASWPWASLGDQLITTGRSSSLGEACPSPRLAAPGESGDMPATSAMTMPSSPLAQDASMARAGRPPASTGQGYGVPPTDGVQIFRRLFAASMARASPAMPSAYPSSRPSASTQTSPTATLEQRQSNSSAGSGSGRQAGRGGHSSSDDAQSRPSPPSHHSSPSARIRTSSRQARERGGSDRAGSAQQSVPPPHHSPLHAGASSSLPQSSIIEPAVAAQQALSTRHSSLEKGRQGRGWLQEQDSSLMNSPQQGTTRSTDAVLDSAYSVTGRNRRPSLSTLKACSDEMLDHAGSEAGETGEADGTSQPQGSSKPLY